jgi:hypothetical protein
MRKQYEIIKPITIKTVLNAITEDDKVLWVYGFINDILCDHSWDYEVTDTNDLLEYLHLTEDLLWFEDKGFLEDVTNKFQPFNFTIRIETEEQLLSLIKNMNIPDAVIERENKGDYKKGYNSDYIYDLWYKLDNIYDEIVN